MRRVRRETQWRWRWRVIKTVSNTNGDDRFVLITRAVYRRITFCAGKRRSYGIRRFTNNNRFTRQTFTTRLTNSEYTTTYVHRPAPTVPDTFIGTILIDVTLTIHASTHTYKYIHEEYARKTQTKSNPWTACVAHKLRNSVFMTESPNHPSSNVARHTRFTINTYCSIKKTRTRLLHNRNPIARNCE